MAKTTQKITRGIYLILSTADLDPKHKKFLVDGVDAEDDYIEMEIEGCKKCVCHDCKGEGSYLGPSFRGQAVEPELMQDEEFMQGYINGAYNVTCTTCNGKNVIDVPNLNEEQEKAYGLWIDFDNQCEAEYAMERAMGA